MHTFVRSKRRIIQKFCLRARERERESEAVLPRGEKARGDEEGWREFFYLVRENKASRGRKRKKENERRRKKEEVRMEVRRSEGECDVKRGEGRRVRAHFQVEPLMNQGTVGRGRQGEMVEGRERKKERERGGDTRPNGESTGRVSYSTPLHSAHSL